MTNKQFQILLNPISKLETVAENNSEKLASIELLTIDIKNIQSESVTELKKQTTILGDIKTFIESQSKNGDNTKERDKEMANAAGFKPLTMKETGLAAFMIVGISAAIVASAALFSFIPTVSPMQLVTAALIAVAFVAIAPAFVKIAEVLSKMKDEISFEGFSSSRVDSSGIMSLVAGSLIAMVGISAAIAISSMILQFVVPVEPIKLLTVFLIGASLIGAAYSFSLIVKNLEGLGLKEIGLATLSIAAISIAMAISSRILQSVSVIKDPWIYLTVFLIGAALVASAFAFSLIVKAIEGKSTKDIMHAGASMVIIAGAIFLTSWIFTALPNPNEMISPPVKWSLESGLAILVFTASFVAILRNIKGISIKELGLAALGTAFVAVALIGVAYLFSYGLAGIDNWVSPPLDWTLKSGLALAIFGVGFVILAKVSKTVGFKGLLLGALGVIVVAAGILATAWIFSVLPDTFIAPDINWALQTAAVMGIFAVPIAIIGAIAVSGAGAAAILLGAVGLILIAGTIWVVAWIFSHMPDVSGTADMITNSLLAPVNGLIDVLKRLNDEIGIDNLLPLAGGIVAISGSLLVLAASVAGLAAGGFAASMANLGSSIADFFSGKETRGPIDTLKELINMADGINKLPTPLQKIANAVSVSDIMGMVSVLGSLASATIKIADVGKSKGFETAVDKLKEISKLDLSDQQKDIAAIAKSYEKIANTSDKINIEALNSTTEMFKALAYLSEQGGKSAIEALGDNLIEAIEELANMIANFEGTVKESSESNSGVAGAIGGFADSVTSGIGSFFGFGGSKEASPAENNAELTRQMKMLVRMLQSGDAKIVIADVQDSAAQKLA